MKRATVGAISCASLVFAAVLTAPARGVEVGGSSCSVGGPPVRLGTTFSHRELANRQLDWRAALDAAGELGLSYVRIGAYWDEIEPVEGYFDFSELDDLVSRLEKKHLDAVLTVGMKAPRWPEYYIPKWAAPKTHAGDRAEISRDTELRARLLRFVDATARHFSSRAGIVAFQVENEPMDRFGPHRNWSGADFVALEARAIRAADARHRPLVINCVSEDQRLSSAPWWDGDYARENALRIADVVGLDVYPKVDGLPFGLPLDWHWKNRAVGVPTKTLREARAAGKDAWIVESQAEPWGRFVPKVRDVEWLVGLHLGQGYRTIGLWGFEWWYEQKVKHGDPTMWNGVKGLVARSK